MSLVIVIALFITSFAPLWLSIVIIEVKSILEGNTDIVTEVTCIFAIAIINMISILIIMHWIKIAQRTTSEELILIKTKENKTVSSEYLLSYILPLFAFDFTRWESVMLFLVFFCTLMFFCVRHNHISLNIFLEILGFSQYECQFKKEGIETEIEKNVIAKSGLNMNNGRLVKVNNLNNELCMAVVE